MINSLKRIMLSIITIFILVPILTIAYMAVGSKDTVVAKPISDISTDKNRANNYTDSKSKELKDKKLQQIDEKNKILIKADNAIPGIKGQWEKVINERHELMKLLTAKENDRKTNKSSLKGHGQEFKNISDGSIKIAWDNFSKAVKADEKDKIKDTFNKFITLNKEINELLSLKINKS